MPEHFWATSCPPPWPDFSDLRRSSPALSSTLILYIAYFQFSDSPLFSQHCQSGLLWLPTPHCAAPMLLMGCHATQQYCKFRLSRQVQFLLQKILNKKTTQIKQLEFFCAQKIVTFVFYSLIFVLLVAFYLFCVFVLQKCFVKKKLKLS